MASDGIGRQPLIRVPGSFAGSSSLWVVSESGSTEIVRALAAAREAYASATQALAYAEDAARKAGVSADTDEPVSELRVQRIRVVEPDGLTRMIIGGSSMSKIAPYRGEDVGHPGRGSFGGILFCNDEGTEAGGMVYTGGVVDGRAQQVGFWTVDDFEQNEGFRVGAAQFGEERSKWIEFADQPYWSMADFMAAAGDKSGEELEAVVREFYPNPNVDGSGITRMRLSKEDGGSVRLSLRDSDGVERIRLVVEADGRAEIACVDLDGVEQPIFRSAIQATIAETQD